MSCSSGISTWAFSGEEIIIQLKENAPFKVAARLMPGLLFSELADIELVQLAVERGIKDERPFRELLHRHQTTVWRICYGFVRNAEDAEDLTQDVFFKAYRSLARFEGRASFKTWVSRIAINTSQNEIRRRSRRPVASQTDLDEMAEALPSPGTVEGQVAVNERQARLENAMGQLRPTEQEALYLKDVEQRPYHEVADVLDISLSAAKMRVQRARLAFRTAYRQLGEPQESSRK